VELLRGGRIDSPNDAFHTPRVSEKS
jgi:hypothetical protein